jgi:hypothetical protein
MINLTKHATSRVDTEVTRHGDDIFLRLIRTDKDTGVSHFTLVLDATDLEHFISTLIELQE